MVVTLNAAVSFGYLIKISEDKTQHRVADLEEIMDHNETRHWLALLPIIGSIFGVIRVLDAIAYYKERPKGWTWTQILRGMGETVGLGILFLLVDLVVTAVRWFHQRSQAKNVANHSDGAVLVRKIPTMREISKRPGLKDRQKGFRAKGFTSNAASSKTDPTKYYTKSRFTCCGLFG